ncbi:DCC1-like thiol-disulfide oxidoreductase family protein [Pseudomonas mosselii]|uniref:thiol-disulfide oxidoreductase DCC family protein n=1 Tax=unclassified Pseudomonas TaxID=196821 RepID=UPI0020C4755D|nr:MULTISPECIES: DCC1-like thiol-disulfide oxidoreductase family protein [unclassified Pseudomonas]MCP8635778.1 DCC1-like thiol-disulfide oxidoreductase family protein [Pseudomonas sp. DVZ6]MDD7786267.1 DCC1-like thiol-disulfide oxidoreductase family protein [Pseudomonas sp. DVZ24]
MPASLIRPSAAPLLAPGETVLLFDGVCRLCNSWARFVIRHDRHLRIRLATVQSAQGQALLAWAGLPVTAFDTMAVMQPSMLVDAFNPVSLNVAGMALCAVAWLSRQDAASQSPANIPSHC